MLKEGAKLEPENKAFPELIEKACCQNLGCLDLKFEQVPRSETGLRPGIAQQAQKDQEKDAADKARLKADAQDVAAAGAILTYLDSTACQEDKGSLVFQHRVVTLFGDVSHARTFNLRDQSDQRALEGPGHSMALMGGMRIKLSYWLSLALGRYTFNASSCGSASFCYGQDVRVELHNASTARAPPKPKAGCLDILHGKSCKQKGSTFCEE